MTEQEDFSCLDTALYLSNCSAHYTESDKYEEKYPQRGERWWVDKNNILGGQRIHLITYLGACWKLEKTKKDSMKHVWSNQGFKNAAGLIWLLEALGADENLIGKAYDAGSRFGENSENQCIQSNAIKKVISWSDDVMPLLSKLEIRKPMR